MTKVKICGLCRVEDVEAVNLVLPDYAGFVFAPGRRRLEPATAAILQEKLDSRIMAVGVFVNESMDAIAEIHKAGIIDVIQLHGDEDDNYIKKLKDNCGCCVIKSVGVGDTMPPESTLPMESDHLLFDTLSLQRGGSGKVFNWDALREYTGLTYFLAGGLSPENVAVAIRLLSPYCVDVSSGVEINGVKDAGRIVDFVNAVRGQITRPCGATLFTKEGWVGG